MIIKLAQFESEMEKEAAASGKVGNWASFFGKYTPEAVQDALSLSKGNLKGAAKHLAGRAEVLGSATGRGLKSVTGVDVAGKADSSFNNVLHHLNKNRTLVGGLGVAGAGAGALAYHNKKK